MSRIKNLFKTLGLLNDDECVSITNLAVYVFLFITAFRSIFSGVVIDLKYFDWKIEALDISSVLPLLFSLINYGHKRVEMNKFNQTKETNNDIKVD